jgi:uncharacterized membrane protein YccF (DUF307 family)
LKGVDVRVIGNILWLVLGGLGLAFAYVVLGLLAMIFIITFPFAVPAFRLAGFALWPFGRVLARKPDAGTGSILGNVVWIVIAGFWLAILHLFAALLNALTIIGIPFALAHVKLAGAALTPFGHQVVPLSEALTTPVVVRVKPLA